MAKNRHTLPQEGAPAPPFVAHTQKGIIHFPEDYRGHWCVFLCHPANFTSGWRMYSDYLAQKERWLQERNTRLLLLSNQTVCGDLWSDIVKRYLSIYLKAPIIEDTDNCIAELYGMSPSWQISPPNHRFLYIIDPEGIVRLIVYRPLLSIQQSLAWVADRLICLQEGKNASNGSDLGSAVPFPLPLHVEEQLDKTLLEKKMRPAYLRKGKNSLN